VTFRGSRNVIGHATIRFLMGHFLLVILGNGVYISLAVFDILGSKYIGAWGYEFDLRGHVTSTLLTWRRRCGLAYYTLYTLQSRRWQLPSR